MLSKDLSINVGNIIWIIGVIFMAGAAFSNISQHEEHISTLEARLEKKIKIIQANQNKINKLELEIAKLKACDHD